MKSVIQTNRKKCYICQVEDGVHKDNHHVFGGNKYTKAKSEQDGMIVFLHRECHRKLHDNYNLELEVKQNAQTIWESMYGDRDDFIKRYGQSYIDRKI